MNNNLPNNLASKKWVITNKLIEKTFKFNNFIQAMVFVNNVADVSERLNHHPDISIRYNQVTIKCYSHSTNSVTEKDLDLAAHIEDDTPAIGGGDTMEQVGVKVEDL